MSGKTRLLLGLVPVVMVFGVVSATWACTYTPHITTITPQAGTRGTEVVMEGHGLAGTHQVEIRWNALEGPVLAQAETDDGSFQTAIRIPDVRPGVYALVADTGDGAVARAAIEVTGDAVVTAAAVDARNPLGWTTSPVPASGSSGGFSGAGALLAVGAVPLFAGAGLLAVRRRRTVPVG